MKTEKARPNRINKILFKKTAKAVDMYNKHGKRKSSMGDRIDNLKAQYERELKEKLREVTELKAKLATLRTLELESAKLANPKAKPDKYANMGLTQAVVDAVDCLKQVSTNGATASQIRDFMIAHGFNLGENPHNFSISVHTTLQRLTEQRRVKRESTDDGNYFRPGVCRYLITTRK